MTGLIIRSFERADTDGVVELWKRGGLTVPWNDPIKKIEAKLLVQPELFLVGNLDGKVVESAMAGYDGHRGWINYLAVDPDHQLCGLGRLMMERAETELRMMGCPKINVQIRTGNIDASEFYASIGFKPDDVISMGKRLIEH